MIVTDGDAPRGRGADEMGRGEQHHPRLGALQPMAGHAQRNRLTEAVTLGLAVLVALAVVACGAQAPSGGPAASGPAVSPGQAIFQNGVDANGVPIPRSVSQNGGGMMGGGTTGSGMMSGSIMNRACANCHGRDGHGRTTSQFTAPDITYANLTDPKGMLMPDGTRGPVYTDAGIEKAVTQGIDPTGSHLQRPMPQWQLTNQDWSDLLAYMKTLR